MPELTFKVIQRPHAPGHTVPFVEHDSGVLRRASAEEEALWEALQEARKELEEAQKPAGGRKR